MEYIDWWKESIVYVPRPIPASMMVGMRDEVRDGKLYLVEFLEAVPEYHPNPHSRAVRVTQMAPLTDNEGDDEEITLAWSRERGFTVLNGVREGSSEQ